MNCIVSHLRTAFSDDNLEQFMDTNLNPKTNRLQRTSTIWSLLCHATGFLVVFGLLSFAFINEAAFTALQKLYQSGDLSRLLFRELLLQIGLSACIWAMGYISYLLLKAQLQTRRTTLLVRARGAVLTETLIIFPVFLLFTMGLAQLTINNMAGLLTGLASYEAGRTLSVWVPEVEARRHNITKEIAIDKATAAAAGVLAPVVTTTLNNCKPNSTTLQKQISGLLTAGNIDIGNIAPMQTTSMVDALDTTILPLRGIAKTRLAYCSTTVNYQLQSNKITTSVQYKHKAAMPLVRRIFGNLDTVAGSPGFYSNFQRQYVTTKQIAPNVVDPY